MSREMWGERWRGERWRGERGERDVRETSKDVNEIMKRWERGER